MRLNGKKITTARGVVYVGEYKGKWTIVAEKDNANVLVRGTKEQAIKKLKELR